MLEASASGIGRSTQGEGRAATAQALPPPVCDPASMHGACWAAWSPQLRPLASQCPARRPARARTPPRAHYRTPPLRPASGTLHEVRRAPPEPSAVAVSSTGQVRSAAVRASPRRQLAGQQRGARAREAAASMCRPSATWAETVNGG
eukprot:scaffold233671_cov30-Tisochrysis_lutea.AAC.2